MTDLEADRPNRRAKRFVFVTLAVLVGAYIVSVLIPPPQVTLEVGPDTTFFTEPLREDGTVDLAAAINQRNRERFGNGTNAAVYLVPAFEIGQTQRTAFAEAVYRELGSPWPPEEVPCVSLGVYAQQLGKDDDAAREMQAQFEKLGSEPWDPTDHAELVGWMKASAAAVQAVEAAAACDGYYWPLIVGDEPDANLLDALSPPLGDYRAVAGIVLAGAMREDSAESPGRRWDRVTTVLRLARLITDGETLVDRLVAAAMVTNAVETAVALLEHGDLNERLAQDIGEQLRALQPWPDMGAAYQRETRLIGCSAFQSLHRQQLAGRLSDDEDARRFAFFDVNAVLRKADVWHDRRDAAFTKPSFRLRYEALHDVESDFDHVVKTWEDESKVLRFIGLTCAPAPVKQRIASEHIFRLTMGIIMPALDRGLRIEADGRARLALLETAIGLRMYHSHHGEYPESLTALVPDFLDTLPIDLLSDKPLIYRREGAGFTLYSVGPNFVDDGGVTATKAIFDNRHDIVIRIGVDAPAPAPEGDE